MRRTTTHGDLTEADRRLVEAALDASATAYAPYSGYAVGAAVLSRSGRIHTGSNLENASYGLGICAEVSAIAVANAADDFDIAAIAVAGHKFVPPVDATMIVTPCGRCRQVIFEAAQTSGIDIRVLSCSGDLRHVDIQPISALLPMAFGPGNLGLDKTWPDMRAALRARVANLHDRAARRTERVAPIGADGA